LELAFSYTPQGKTHLEVLISFRRKGKPLSKLANTTKNQQERNQ
jgi:hypothetical protein